MYKAEVNLTFVISDDSGANDEEIVDKILEKTRSLQDFLRFKINGPWDDVVDSYVKGIYNKEKQLIWYE